MAKKISKLDVTLNGLMGAIVNAIKAWKPAACDREVQCSAALAEYLREVCPPDTRVETEYRDGGTTIDVWLSWQGLLFPGQVFFEVKRNLDKKSDLDRLVGQIAALQPGKRKVVVVLVGETNKELLGRLKEHYKAALDEDEDAMRIVTVKPISAGGHRGR